MAAAPPAVPDDLVQEILLRLPPDDPACLLRASIVCKDWAGIVSRPAFRRRLHELHRTPPVLGFLNSWSFVPSRIHPHIISTAASSFSPAAPDWHSWRVQDCRHGRALFISSSSGKGNLELLVWEPTTGAQQRVPVPAAFGSRNNYPMAAVLCAADGCDHTDCLGGPFRVVFSFNVFPEEFDPQDEEWVSSATVYSSETGTWGELTSVHSEFLINHQRYSSLLVGSSLLYFRGTPEHTSIMEYDVARHALTVFQPPGDCSGVRCNLMLTEDGGLGIIEDSFDQHVKLWTREASDGTDARWVLSREICLDNLLPIGARSDERYGLVLVLRFVEGANAILVSTVAGLFTIDLHSEQVRKVCNYHGFSGLIPVVGFYTPVPRGEHQNLLALKPGEEAGGGEEKTVDQAQLLLGKGSNAIKEGDFVNSFESISHGHNMRVPRYEEVALEGASTLNIYGGTLLPKAAPNEESVMGTSSKEDAGNSTTSGSNVECAPPSRKDLDERILKQQDEEEGSVNTNKKKEKKRVGHLEDVNAVQLLSSHQGVAAERHGRPFVDDWTSIISCPGFRRRLHEIHRAPPVLGFLNSEASERTPCFIPTTALSFTLAAPDRCSWRPLNCRHGRALFLSRSKDAKELLVWEPITGTQERVPLPVAFEFGYSDAAVFCAVDGCDHRDCLGGPFCVLFVFSSKQDADEYVTSACAYSSEIGAWSGMTTMHGEFIGFTNYSSVLIDNSLLYFIVYDYVDNDSILEYDLSRHVLTMFSVPYNYCDCVCTLMVTEEGGLGLIQDLYRHLKLWTREASDGADAKWLLSRVIYPHNLLPTSASLDECYVVALKVFAEGANAIFVNTVAGVFAIDQQSEQARKVSDHCGFSFHKWVPIVTFYTPAPRGDHQNQLVSKPIEEGCNGEGEEGEKTIHQAQQLFNKGSNAINEGEFVNTFECISHDNNVRVPHHGEVALGCAATFKKYRCTYNAQEMNDSMDDVPKSASSEESLKGTGSKDDAGTQIPLVAILR